MYYLLTWNCKHLGPLTMQRVHTYFGRNDFSAIGRTMTSTFPFRKDVGNGITFASFGSLYDLPYNFHLIALCIIVDKKKKLKAGC